ncbi:FAD-dependent oxidoreductase [Streptomyces sp. A7024]|uniref:FAD-dependent oxidoreductase n=1 Tax=Streptomyces coryli TaxID=1128680 RepID=A0A6G4TZI0_9ACTN|nr:FAD-dependent oxidoreductase [Streptomyces coryli]NGN65162.1 FAD-dependent oxidoreductase [Streptomyces coryli]
MDRRKVIKAGLAAGVVGGASAALTTGCTGGDGGGKDDKPGRKPPGGSGRKADWAALAGSLEGKLVRPDDGAYRTARQLYNSRYDSLEPAAIAYISSAADARECLEFARRARVPVAIRSGGHSYGGYSSGNGRLIVDVSALDSVEASRKSAVIGAGARLIDVYSGLSTSGRTVPAGSCATVGIAGLTLGGGHGVVSRAYGLTCDSLSGATVVTADGKIREVSAKRDKDLFWALRGAGNGNFGVVTELRFRTHKASDVVMAQMSWPWSKAAAVLRAWQRWGPDQPDEIWSACHLGANAGADPTISVSALSLGDEDDLKDAIDRLADAPGGPGQAKSVNVSTVTYQHAMNVYAGCTAVGVEQCHLPGAVPGRNRDGVMKREASSARSDFFDGGIGEAGVRALVEHAERASKAGRGVDGMILLTAMGGAVNRVGEDETAFVHRGTRVLAQYYAKWAGEDASDGRSSPKPAEAWLDRTHAALRRDASGAAYQNYADPRLKGWRKAYYGGAVKRLERVKERYDGERLFSYPQGL